MRTHVLYSIKNLIAFLLATFLMLGCSSFAIASAQEVATTTAPAPQKSDELKITPYGNIGSGYVFQEVGLVATTEPVFQGGVTFTKGRWSLDIWNSSGLQVHDGSYGNRGFKDEVDFTVQRTSHFTAPLVGPVHATYSADYLILSNFAKMKGDVIVTYAQFDRPIMLGTTTLTASIRLSRWIGIAAPSISLVRPSLSLDVPINDKWSANILAARSYDLTDKYATNYDIVSASRTLGSHTNLNLTVKITEKCPTVVLVGFSFH